jgi:hypothetical protein
MILEKAIYSRGIGESKNLTSYNQAVNEYNRRALEYIT